MFEHPNIFKIASAGKTSEDLFTASLAYLIDNIPAVGQAMVDAIANATHIGSTRFVSAHDHPDGDDESKPDFLLHCEDFDLLLEHKLESQLGTLQLERYLALKSDRPRYTALISNTRHPISVEVHGHERYLRPQAARHGHFLWETFYPEIASRPERLAQEFAQYMRALGMKPDTLVSTWGGLFYDPAIAGAFYERTAALRKYCKQQGASCRPDSGRRGFQVSKLYPWLHLLYFTASTKSSVPVEELNGPYLSARVFLSTDEADRIAKFATCHERLDWPQGMMIGVGGNEPASWNKSLRLVYECTSALKNYLTNNPHETQDHLLDFGTRVNEHIRAIAQQI